MNLVSVYAIEIYSRLPSKTMVCFDFGYSHECVISFITHYISFHVCCFKDNVQYLLLFKV